MSRKSNRFVFRKARVFDQVDPEQQRLADKSYAGLRILRFASVQSVAALSLPFDADRWRLLYP